MFQGMGPVVKGKANSKAGQVKFELIETGTDQYTGIWYNRMHNLYLAPIQFNAQKGGLSDEGWYKHGVVLH